MTVEFYELAQRLYAAHTGTPVLRVAAALVALSPTAVFVHTEHAGEQVSAQIATAEGGVQSAIGDRHMLACLHRAGIRFERETPCQLVLADTAGIAALAKAARTHRDCDDAAVAEAAAAIGWCVDRCGYPGSGAVIDLLAASRQRFITGDTPERERSTQHWRSVFGVPDSPAGMITWAALIAGGQILAGLESAIDDDLYTYTCAGQRFTEGGDWTAQDRAPAAALGLRRRCNAADLWETLLLGDQLWRHRAVHTGNVAGGVVISQSRAAFTVACERLDSRLREGSKIQGWQGGIDKPNHVLPFVGDVSATEAIDGQLHLSVTRVHIKAQPEVGQWVTLMPAQPQPAQVKSALFTYRKLLTGSQASWIASGKTPPPISRDVPLDVLIAAAETE